MTVARSCRKGTEHTGKRIELALPPADLSLEQDEEWCVVRVDDGWRRMRIHDYDRLYAVPGLYERLLRDVLKCDSPHVVRDLLEAVVRDSGGRPDELRVLDLGAGNGMVGEELGDMGVRVIVGVDIITAARAAAFRDRPDVYEDYRVLDMTDLTPEQRVSLAAQRFNCLTCVAALGFGDIPTRAFAAAYNLIAKGGLIAFNIKADFLDDTDDTGFAGLIRSMTANGTLSLHKRRRYCHRLGTDRQPIDYVAMIGSKQRDLPHSS